MAAARAPVSKFGTPGAKPKAKALQQQGDFDWGRALWDEGAERATLFVSRTSGTTLLLGLLDGSPRGRMGVPAGEHLHLALGENPQRVDADGVRWVRVRASATETKQSETGGQHAESLWWARWDDLELLVGEVVSAAHDEAVLDDMFEKEQKTPLRDKVKNQAWVQGYWHRMGFDCSGPQQNAASSPADLMVRAYVRQVSHANNVRCAFDCSTSSTDEDPTVLDWSLCPNARAVSPSAVQGRVSVVCPTYPKRHQFHESLYRCFCAQTWPDKELLVLDTGGCASPFFGPRRSGALAAKAAADERVLYVHLPAYPLTLGHKRNQLIQLASGEIVAHFDDDNLYAPEYLSKMVDHLKASSAQLVHVTAAFSWDVRPDQLWWHSGLGSRAEAFVHLRGPLRALAFRHTDCGEESGVSSTCVVQCVDDPFGVFLHVNHGSNVSSYDHTDSKHHTCRRVRPDDIPNKGLRSMLEAHRRFY